MVVKIELIVVKNHRYKYNYIMLLLNICEERISKSIDTISAAKLDVCNRNKYFIYIFITT